MDKLYDKRFDDATKIKLRIFRDYLTSWLPVFVREQKHWNTVNVFDFFAGPGKNKFGEKGSPLIIIDEIKKFSVKAEESDISLNLYFNELNGEYLDELKKNLSSFNLNFSQFKIHFSNQKFRDCFDENYKTIASGKTANLLFMDQFGVKEINPEIFGRLIRAKTTDFLFFISSSIFNRFHDVEDMKPYSDWVKEGKEKPSYELIHKHVLNRYSSMVPEELKLKYYLAPFSLKKGSNIYGLIFGTGHILGQHKFLETAWKHDPTRGEANYDIDGEIVLQDQFTILGEEQKAKKLTLFEQNIRQGILNGSIPDEKDLYLSTIRQGFIPKHSRKVINGMIEGGELEKIKPVLTHKVLRNSNPQKFVILRKD